MNVLHATGPLGEFMLCGVAVDAQASGDSAEPIVAAKPGEYVTCPQCQAVIDSVQRSFRSLSYMQRNT